MARGNQRDLQREKGKKRQEKNQHTTAADHEANKGLTLEQRKARDAEILRQKQMKALEKKEQEAGQTTSAKA